MSGIVHRNKIHINHSRKSLSGVFEMSVFDVSHQTMHQVTYAWKFALITDYHYTRILLTRKLQHMIYLFTLSNNISSLSAIRIYVGCVFDGLSQLNESYSVHKPISNGKQLKLMKYNMHISLIDKNIRSLY